MLPLTFIFLGRSGCGKGTQAKLLIDYLKQTSKRDVCLIESGATFRHFVSKEGYTNNLAREIISQGGLQPEFLSVWVWSNVLVERFQDKEAHLIFDGMPRKPLEAPILDAALDFYARGERYFVHLDVSPAWALERLLERKRDDDTEEFIKNRLAWFESDVVPTIAYFRENKKYRFLSINGEQSIENVHIDIVKGLEHGR